MLRPCFILPLRTILPCPCLTFCGKKKWEFFGILPICQGFSLNLSDSESFRELRKLMMTYASTSCTLCSQMSYRKRAKPQPQCLDRRGKIDLTSHNARSMPKTLIASSILLLIQFTQRSQVNRVTHHALLTGFSSHSPIASKAT